MTHKKVNNADPGTATKFGGNDLDKWSDFASGVDTDDYDINSDIAFRYDKAQIRNSANTFGHKLQTTATAARSLTLPDYSGEAILRQTNNAVDFVAATAGVYFRNGTLITYNPAATSAYIFKGSAIVANRDVTLPLLTANDTLVAEAHTQTLTNKEIDIALNVLKLRLYSSIVFKSGTTYYALNASGAIISSGAVAETVIAAALAPGGTIFIASGFYALSAAFTGFNLGTNDHVICGRDALIQVPNGYNGYVFKIAGNATGTIIEGGIFNEAGTPARLWTWVLFDANSNGIYANIVRDNIVESPNIGIRLYVATTTGWMTSNIFENIKMTFANVFVDFDYTATWPGSDGYGFWNNTFINFYCQMGANSTYGFKNIRHGRNVFINCAVWDATGAQVNSNFHADSTYNVVIGGIMTYLNFTDASTTGTNIILDTWQGGISMGLNKVKMGDGGLLKRHATGVIAARNTADSAYGNFRSDSLQTFNLTDQAGTALANIATNTLTFYDAKNIAFNATTGTKIGTATTQKLSFYNATPIVQGASIADATDLTTAISRVNLVISRLEALGLIATV